MKKFLRTIAMTAALAAGLGAFATLPARALVEIDVNKGNVTPMPIAITDFQSNGGLGTEIAGIVTALGEALYFHLKVGASFADVLLDADLDFTDGARPLWWPLGAALLCALVLVVWRFATSAPEPAARKLRNALT